MARRNDSFLVALAEVPWWISVCLGGFCYFGLKIILPAMTFEHPLINGLAKTTAPNVAWISGLFLLPAAKSAFNSFRKSKQLDRQRDVDSIRNLSWKEFEELLAEAYCRKGYRVVENTSRGADGGIDLRLEQSGNRYLVQCKQWRSVKVGVSIVREMYGVMMHEKADGVIIVTSGMFTQEAKNFISDKPIDLVEGHQLVEMINSVQSNTSMHNEPPAADSSKICPRCGRQLELKLAKKGSNAGNKFWGCSGFPKCRFTESL